MAYATLDMFIRHCYALLRCHATLHERARRREALDAIFDADADAFTFECHYARYELLFMLYYFVYVIILMLYY